MAAAGLSVKIPNAGSIPPLGWLKPFEGEFSSLFLRITLPAFHTTLQSKPTYFTLHLKTVLLHHMCAYVYAHIRVSSVAPDSVDIGTSRVQ